MRLLLTAIWLALFCLSSSCVHTPDCEPCYACEPCESAVNCEEEVKEAKIKLLTIIDLYKKNLSECGCKELTDEKPPY